jgi:hypothetical protein
MIVKTWQVFKSFFFIAGISICLLVLIFEIKGLPKNLELGIRQQLDTETLKFTFGDIQFGPISGLRVTDAKITDLKHDKHVLYSAHEIKVKFEQNNTLNGQFNPSSFSIKGGNFSVPFDLGSQHKTFELKNCTLKASFPSENKISIDQLSGNSKYLAMEISGEVINIPTPKETQSTKKIQIPDTDRLNEIIPINLRQQVFQLRDTLKELNIASKAKLQAHCIIDASSPSESKIEATLDVPAFLYRGNAIRQLHIELSLTNESVIIKSFKLEADDNETINGEFQYNLASKVIQGHIYGRFFPTRYLKIFAPQYAQHIDFITFSKSPPELNIIIEPSPIDNIEKLKIRGSAKITNFAIQGFPIDLLEGDFFVDGLSINAPKMQVHSPNINGFAGVSFSPKDKLIHVTGDCLGDPRHISHFIFSKTARRNYLNIWTRFAWGSAARPHWKGYFSFDLKDNSMVFDGNFQANGVTINGIKTQSLSADIIMNFPGHILINDLKLEATSGSARASLGFRDVNTECQMDYAFHSSLPLQNVIQLINPDWTNINDIFNMSGDNYIRATGSFPLSDPLAVRSEAYLEVANTLYNDIAIEDAILTLNLRDKKLIIASQKAKLYSGDLHLYYQEDLTNRNQSIKLTGDKIDLAGVISDTQKAALTTASGKIDFGIDLNLKSQDGLIKSVLGDGYVHITEGLFWEVPFLSQFFSTIENVLPFSSATKIKAISAQLNFYEKNIQIDRFFTDGSLLALSGDGNFNWGDTSYEFNIKTHYLKSVLVLPRPINVDILKGIFSPFSVLAKAKVTGKGNDWEWDIDVMKNLGDSIKNIPSAILAPFKKLFK